MSTDKRPSAGDPLAETEPVRAEKTSRHVAEATIAKATIAKAIIAERQRLLDVLETLPVMVCLLTPDYHIAFANRGFRKRFGEANGRRCYEYHFGYSAPCAFCESFGVLETGRPHQWEVTLADGTVIEAHDFPFTDVDGAPMVLEMDLDITAQRRSQAELAKHREQLEQQVSERTASLAEANAMLRQTAEKLRQVNETLEQRVAERTAQLRALAARLVQAEEQERRRMAQTLHDGLQQTLVAAALQLNVALRYAAKEGHPCIREALRLLDEAIGTSRSLTAELSPAILHDDGLAPALSWLARRVRERYGLEVALQVSEDAAARRIPADAAILLFQGASELLFNVFKHAGVQEAEMELSCDDQGALKLTVADRGNGFDPAPGAETQGEGFGLFSVQERMLYAGGQCAIESAPGRGAKVTLTLPLGPQAAAGPPPAAARAALRLLLVDDHAIVRRGMAQLLGAEPDLQVVGEAGDGLEGVSLALQLRPDVVLMDISMPKMDGIEATRRIMAGCPGTAVIGLSMYDDEERERLMRQAGAADYVAKGGPPESLVAAIWACRGC